MQKFSKKTKSFIVAIISCIALFFLLSFMFNAEDIIFTSANITASPDVVKIGDYFDVTVTVGTASSESTPKTSFLIFTDNKNIEFVNFTDGTYHTTLPSGEVVDYSLENKDDGIYITTNELTNGDTIQLNLRAKFKEESSSNDEVANIVIRGNNQKLAETKVSATCGINWEDNKTGPSDIKLIDDNGIKMTGDNTYTITQTPLSETTIKDENVKSIKITDTITLPEGMSFSATDNDSIIKALGLDSIKEKNLIIEASDSAAIFSWEDGNSQITYEFTLNNEYFLFDDNFSEGNIRNVLTTTIVSQTGNEKQLSPKEVNSHLYIVSSDDYIKDFKKEIIDTNASTLGKDGSWGYILQNDIVLYKISFTNNSNKTQNYSLVDTIPEGMEIISKEEIFNSNYPNVLGDTKNSETKIDGNTITWNIKNVSPNESVSAYVYLKANINADTTLTNTAALEDKQSSVSVDLKKEQNTINIEKSADYDGTTKGKEFNYTIKIYNPNHISITNKEIKDSVPDCLEILATNVEYCGNNSTSGDITVNKNDIYIKNIKIYQYESISYKIHVKIKDNYSGEAFKNTAYIIDNGKEESSATFENNSIDKTTMEKTVSDSTVFPNDEFSYSIKIYNGNSDDKDYSSNPTVFKDSINDCFEIKDAYYSLNGKKLTDGLIIENNTISLSFNGVIKAHNTLEITIFCKVKESAKAQTITNTAYFDDKQASVDITISSESNNLSVQKTAYHTDGSVIEDGKVTKGETVLFNVKVSNLSKTSSLKRINLKDNFNGEFKKVDIPNGIMKVTVIDVSNVNGFVEAGTVLDKKNAWTTDLRWSDTRFIISNKEEYDALYYSDDFEILPKGYLTIQYEAIIGDNFKDGTNEIILNDEFKDEVYLSTLDTPLIEIKKSTETHNYSVDELENLEIPYTITVYNMSNFDGYFQHFTIKDTLPDGLEFVGRWWGNTDPWIEVYYEGQYLWDWSYDKKGGHFYPKIDGNTLSVEFGSCDDNGNQNLINFNQGEKIEIKVKCKFTKEKIKELQQKEEYVYPYESFTNTAILTSDENFKNLDGEIVNSLEADETINVVPIVPSPGIEKEFVGAYSGSYSNSKKISDVPSVGDNLIWKITIKNFNKDGPCGPLGNFSIEDIMPENYLYNDAYENKMYKTVNGQQEEMEYISPSIDENTLRWDMKDIVLKEDETLTIEVCLKNDGTNKYSMLLNTAKLKCKDKIENISSGERIDDYTITDSAQTSTLLYKTSSYKTVSYSPCGKHRNDPNEAIAYGYLTSPNNNIQAKQGENVTYSLYLKNESNNALKNVFFIDRLPYSGDKSIVSYYSRNSAFNVLYNGLISAILYDKDGNQIKDISSEIKISFSNSKKKIPDNAKDWMGENDVAQWHDEYSENDVNVRFDLSSVEMSSLNYVVISFSGKVPEYVSAIGEDNIAWNNFAYSYSTDANSQIMVAEPAKVGVWVSETNNDGNICLTKNVNADIITDRTFYFALFKKIDDQYQIYSTIQAVTVKETATIEFDNLPYDTYYVFEVDENGNILDSNKIIGQGQKVIVSDDSKNEITIENIITNKKPNFKLIKSDNSDKSIKLEGAKFSLSNDETSYELITDKNGEAIISNIEFGTYTLTEIKAPDGYQLLDSPIKITITPESIVDDTYTCNVYNIKKIYMPQTGGIGKIGYLYVGSFFIIIKIILKKNYCKKTQHIL